MNHHPTILRVLNECVSVDLFTGPTGTPAVDLLPELAEFIHTTLAGELDAASRRLGLIQLIALGMRTGGVTALFREGATQPPASPAECRRRAFLCAVVANLCRVSTPPDSRFDWLAVLPPSGVLFPPGPLENDIHPDVLRQVGYRRHSWTTHEGKDLLHCLLDAEGDKVLARAEELGVQLLRTANQVWLVDGTIHDVPLTQRIREVGNALGIIALLQECARAVGRFHRYGLAHGDLRPACLVVLPEGSVELRGCVESVLVQTALRRQRESRGRCILLHEALQGEGSLLYASPQVQRGNVANPTDDVYSLATIVYQLYLGDLLAGRPGGSAWREELKGRQAPSWLIDLLDACWSDRAEDRPVDGGDLAEQIDDHVEANRGVLLTGPVLEGFADAAGYLRRAETETELGKPNLALLYIERAMRFGPALPTLHARASVCYRRKQYSQVVEDCTAILLRDPTQHRARALLGAAYSDLGRDEEAVSELTRAIPMLPPDALWFALRARSLLALNHPDEAQADCEESLALKPLWTVALCVRGEIHRRKRRFREAIYDCTLALDYDPDCGAARRTRTLARAESGDYSGALKDFEVVLQQKPGDVELLLARADMFECWQHYPEAVVDYQRVLTLVPDQPLALAGLARCRERQLA